MEITNPSDETEKPVILASLFSFIRGASPSELRLARANLKLECLLQNVCTIPGSMVLTDPELGLMVEENIELVKAGALVLDLRDTASSFSDLTKQRFGSKASPKMLETAAFLDTNCPRVFRFDPRQSSTDYKMYMLSFLVRADVTTDAEKYKVEEVIERIEAAEPYLTLESLLATTTGAPNVDSLIRSAAKFFYCICGSRALAGIAQVPHDLWTSVHPKTSTLHYDPASATDETATTTAHNAVLEHFAINATAFYRLTASDIVELRSDGATRRSLSQLRQIAERTLQDFAFDARIPKANADALMQCREEIHRKVADLCLRQAKQAPLEGFAGMGVSEVAIAIGKEVVEGGIPYVGLMRKGVMRMGRGISKLHPNLAAADFTLSPLHTYIVRLQGKIGKRPSQ